MRDLAALDSGLEVLFQPLIEPGTGRVVGFELRHDIDVLRMCFLGAHRRTLRQRRRSFKDDGEQPLI